MVIFVGNLFELGDVHETSEVVEVKHVVILAVFAEESHVLAEIHVLKMISNETAIAALNALAEFL